MSLDNIINQVLSLKMPRNTAGSSLSAVEFGMLIGSLTTAMGRKADDIAYILNGKGNRADAQELEDTLISLLPNNLALLNKALNKLTAIDDQTGVIHKTYYLGLLHIVIYKKIESIKNPAIEVQANPNMPLLLDLNDLCAEFLKKIKASIIKKLTQAGLYVSLEDYCRQNATKIASPDEKVALQNKYYKWLERTINQLAEVDVDFRALQQQHRAVYRLQDKLFDTNYPLSERSFVFESRLKMDLAVVTRNFAPDPALTVFLKGIVVLLAFVVTLPLLGVGGYLAYNSLFKTENQKFIENTNKLKHKHGPQQVELSDVSLQYQKLNF